MHEIDLGGHSGCKIVLCEPDDNTIFVRKISGDDVYNDRLMAQAKKQKLYKNNKLKTPDIISEGYTEEGLYYFDMEYIQGITLAEYMKTIEIGKVRGLVQSIVNSIVASDDCNGTCDESIFIKKIDSLIQQLAAQNNKIVNEALQMLKNHSWHCFKTSICHGDLTLENIIVKDNQLYFIDFLDSFYNCWIMDISTLLQDVQTLWSYRMDDEISINTVLRLIVFRDILMDEMKVKMGEKNIEIYYALLLKLIRIYPYTNDKETLHFLDEKTSSIINIIKEAYL